MMSEASDATKRMHVSQVIAAQEISTNILGRDVPIARNGELYTPEHRQKTQALWRDVLFMSLYCRLPIVITTDAGEYRPVTSLFDLSRILDVISQTPGAVLYRDNEWWVAVPPGTPGQRLTVGIDGFPLWQTVADGGAGGAWSIKNSVNTSTSGFAAKGCYFTPAVSYEVHAAAAYITQTLAGETYEYRIFEATGTTLVSLVAKSSSITPGPQTNPLLVFDLATPANLAAGQRYCELVVRTGAGGTAPVRIHGSNTFLGPPQAAQMTNAFATNDDPQPSDTISTSADWGYNIVHQYVPST